MMKLKNHLTVVVMVLLSCTLTVYSQSADMKTFRRLQTTVELRERLVSQFNAFVEYEMTKQYEKQFDLVAAAGLAQRNKANLTREEYVAEKRKLVEVNGEVLELKVQNVDREFKEGNYVAINVRVVLQKDGRKDTDQPIMLADRTDGDWYFTLTYFDV